MESVEMTAGEAAHAANQQQHINQQVHADRQANGGRLTPQEHQQVNREQKSCQPADSPREPQRTPGAAVELKSL
jgi:hypothetical protein